MAVPISFNAGEGGAVGRGGHPTGDPESLLLLEALKAPKKICGLNGLAPKAPEKFLDWPKARRKVWPHPPLLRTACKGCQSRPSGRVIPQRTSPSVDRFEAGTRPDWVESDCV